jgi:hypothetical protein
LNEIYQENPLKLAHKFKKLNKDNLQKLQENDKKRKRDERGGSDKKYNYDVFEDYGSLNNNNQSGRKVNFMAKINKSNLLIPLIKIMTVTFVVYYIYSLVFYYIFQNSYESLILTSNYLKYNIDLDNDLMNCIILLQAMMFTSTTDNQFLNLLRNPNIQGLNINDDGFLKGKMSIMMTMNYEIIREQINYKEFDLVIQSDYNLMDCTNIFSGLSDDVFENMKQYYGSEQLFTSLQNLCKSYAIMIQNKIFYLIEYINYESLGLLNLFNEAIVKGYSQIKELNDNDKFLDVFSLIVLILRPIQTYLIDEVISQIINSSADNYLYITLTYLILNIIVDIIIFYIINKKVVSKVFEINKEIKCLIDAVNIQAVTN